MKTSGFRCETKFGLLFFLGHPSPQSYPNPNRPTIERVDKVPTTAIVCTNLKDRTLKYNLHVNKMYLQIR